MNSCKRTWTREQSICLLFHKCVIHGKYEAGGLKGCFFCRTSKRQEPAQLRPVPFLEAADAR